MSGILASLEFEQIAVYKPGEVEYEKSVATAYLLYRFARPSYVVQPTHPAQVQDIVRYLIEYNDRQKPDSQVSITIKNGGHSYAGFSSTDKGILLDLSKINRVKLNLDKVSHPKSVTIRGGALWGHVYKQLINGRHKGYMLAGGDCSTVGVSGFVLGGGLSAFSRSLGMACDNLTEATIITADGRMVTVGENSDPDSDEGKLFWALRGGGAGNFGIVVQLKMNIHQFQKEDDSARTRETVIAGRYTWFPYPGEVEEAKLMATMNEFYTTKWVDSLAIHSTWICDLQEARTLPAIRFIVYHNGEKNNFVSSLTNWSNKGIHRIKRASGGGSWRNLSEGEPTTLFLHETLLAQWSEETQMFFPSDKSYKYFSSFVFENDESTIKEVTSMIKDRVRAFRNQFSGQQGLLQVTPIHSGGKAGSPAANATAFPRRKDICYITYIMVRWREKWLGEEMKSF
ncbi:hypothetical protein COH20_005630 [Aspergillus flavus]|nr:hypothetical protein G4B11_006212 [Aspergillus flavus]RAQ56740.1 hypothetical protein COH20_005630 [Aspergillus flavus]RAQ62751.1 hypothetical protein COH21_006482 [Aspergillus flavus]